jgi:hypothetical protein
MHGNAESPDWHSVPLQMLFCKNPRSAWGPSTYGGVAEAAESVTAQIKPQSNLATPRRGNRKILTKTTCKKQKTRSVEGSNYTDLSNDTENKQFST